MARMANAPWKGIYGKDRRYTARVDRAIARDQYTPPGTPSNPPKRKRKG